MFSKTKKLMRNRILIYLSYQYLLRNTKNINIRKNKKMTTTKIQHNKEVTERVKKYIFIFVLFSNAKCVVDHLA
jgi:hypothetical protein